MIDLGPYFSRRGTATDSTVITSFWYNPNERLLAVEFSSGSIWVYDRVMPSVAARMFVIHSIGQYFNMHIRNTYSGIRILPSPTSRVLSRPLSPAIQEILRVHQGAAQ